MRILFGLAVFGLVFLAAAGNEGGFGGLPVPPVSGPTSHVSESVPHVSESVPHVSEPVPHVSGQARLTEADLVAMAMRAAGEAEVLGCRGMAWVAATMYNRLLDPGYPATVAGVLTAYHAPDDPDGVGYVACVRDGIRMVEQGQVPRNVVYALSARDLVTLCADGGLAVHVERHPSGRWAVYFFDRWPEGTAC